MFSHVLRTGKLTIKIKNKRRENMKRYLAILVAAMMMVCLLAGCAGGDKATGGEKETLIIGEAGQWW